MSTYICKSCKKRNEIRPEWKESKEPVIIVKCKFCDNKARYSPKRNAPAPKITTKPGTRIVGLSENNSKKKTISNLRLEVLSGTEGQNSFNIVPKEQSFTVFFGRNPKSKSMMMAGSEDEFFIVDDPYVSRLHGSLSVTNKNGKLRITIEDKGSANGTLLNSSNLNQGDIAILNEGDIIQLGDTKFKFQTT